jgi:AcrR family transcriptional regulator
MNERSFIGCKMSLPAAPTVPQTETASRGEQTRAAILEAAYHLFSQHGYHGTSMRQIAHEAGLALGGIYNHFDGKESLFAAVLDANHPYHHILPALAAAEGDTVDDFVRDAARRMHSIFADIDQRLLPLVFIELIEFHGRHVARMAETVFPHLMAFASRFAERPGRLRPLPTLTRLRTFMGLIISSVFIEAFLRSTPLLQGMQDDGFDGMLDIYLHGIVAADPPAPDGAEPEGP